MKKLIVIIFLVLMGLIQESCNSCSIKDFNKAIAKSDAISWGDDVYKLVVNYGDNFDCEAPIYSKVFVAEGDTVFYESCTSIFGDVTSYSVTGIISKKAPQ